MPKYSFSDIAINVTEKRMPVPEDRFLYVAPNNLDTETLTVPEYGYKVNLNGTKLIMHKGDMLFGRREPQLKHAAIAPHDGLFSAHGMIFHPKTDVITQDFFPFFISSDYFFDAAIKIAVGSLSPTVNWKDLKSLEFQIPSIEDQNKYAKILWGIIRSKKAYKRVIESADGLVDALLTELISTCCEKKRLDEYATLITKGASPRWQGIEYSDTGTLFITSENVREGFLDFTKRKYLPNEINEILPRSVLKKNDVLINIVNASIGRAALYDSDELANINQAVALVRIKPGVINMSFLLAYLNSSEARRTYDLMKVGGDKANLSLKNIADLMIPVVDMKTQERFAAFIDQLQTSKLSAQNAFNDLSSLQKALLRQCLGN